MAPELLRGARNSVASDVYAFGVVIYEMATKLDPFEGEDYHDVIHGVVKEKRRPELPRGVANELAMIMRECWHWDPRRRPTFLELERRMAHFDSLHSAERNMRRNHGNNLVLDQVFPAHVAKALAAGQKLAPEHYDSVTIFFSDIVGFTDISKAIAPEKVCDMLDRLYTRFDILTENYDIFKVETIGGWTGRWGWAAVCA
jgi:serine/threonine protein kinase